MAIAHYTDTLLNSSTSGAISGASILVRVHGNTAAATIYSDAGGTIPKTNPLTSDGSGAYDFYASDAVIYDMDITATGYKTYTRVGFTTTYLHPIAIPTMQNIIDASRTDDGDTTVPYLVSDVTRLRFCNEGLDSMFGIRPDLFMDQYTTASLGHDLIVTDSLPIQARYKRILVDYVIARSSMVNDADVLSQRADQLMRQFMTSL